MESCHERGPAVRESVAIWCELIGRSLPYTGVIVAGVTVGTILVLTTLIVIVSALVTRLAVLPFRGIGAVLRWMLFVHAAAVTATNSRTQGEAHDARTDQGS